MVAQSPRAAGPVRAAAGPERGDVVERAGGEVEVGLERDAEPRRRPARPGRAGPPGGSRRRTRRRGRPPGRSSATSNDRPPRSRDDLAARAGRRPRRTRRRRPAARRRPRRSGSDDQRVQRAPGAGGGPARRGRASRRGGRRPLRRPGSTARGHLGDGGVGGGDHQQVDARRRAADVVVPAEQSARPASRPRPAPRASDRPARPGPIDPQRAAPRSRRAGSQLESGSTRRTRPSARSCQSSGTRSGARSGSGASTNRRSAMRGCGICRSGSSTVTPSIQMMSTSSVRGPQRSSRTRSAADSSRWHTPSSCAGRQVGVELDHEVEERRPGRRARRPGRSRTRGDTADRRRRASRPPRARSCRAVAQVGAERRGSARVTAACRADAARPTWRACWGTGGRSLRTATVTPTARGVDASTVVGDARRPAARAARTARS